METKSYPGINGWKAENAVLTMPSIVGRGTKKVTDKDIKHQKRPGTGANFPLRSLVV